MTSAKAQRTFPIIVEKDEDGFFVAINPALPGCYSQGKTIDEALVNVQEATEMFLEASPEEAKTVSPLNVSVHLIAA